VRKGERAGAVKPGEEKAPGRPYCSLSVPEGACKRAGEGLFTRAWSDRTRGTGVVQTTWVCLPGVQYTSIHTEQRYFTAYLCKYGYLSQDSTPCSQINGYLYT